MLSARARCCAIGRDLRASMQLSLINGLPVVAGVFHLVAGRVGDMVGGSALFLSGLSCCRHVGLAAVRDEHRLFCAAVSYRRWAPPS
ncbi:MAG: hypothetical protein ACLRWP_09400 [Bilophila wadsworthia]